GGPHGDVGDVVPHAQVLVLVETVVPDGSAALGDGRVPVLPHPQGGDGVEAGLGASAGTIELSSTDLVERGGQVRDDLADLVVGHRLGFLAGRNLSSRYMSPSWGRWCA